MRSAERLIGPRALAALRLTGPPPTMITSYACIGAFRYCQDRRCGSEPKQATSKRNFGEPQHCNCSLIRSLGSHADVFGGHEILLVSTMCIRVYVRIRSPDVRMAKVHVMLSRKGRIVLFKRR